MCGIIACIGVADPLLGPRMLDAIGHRGEDERRIERIGEQCLLGISRLSIVDARGGSQPLHDPARRLHLVCNGEIYNHRSLRDDLSHEFDFSSDSDSEVILALFRKYGAACAGFLDGMFAFVVYDELTGDFLACRDRYGIKPLYYARTRRAWYFASEAKAFAVLDEDIEAFDLIEPGAQVVCSTLQRWHERAAPRAKSVPSAAMVRALLEASVEKHLMVDQHIGVGTFLSGGIDSSIVTALCAKYRPDTTAFTVGVPGSPDIAAAQRVCEHLAIPHVIRWLELDEARALLPDAVRHTESFNPALVLEGLMTMLLAKAAREAGVKVVLCGEGADEIFAGYGVFLNKSPDAFGRCMRLALDNIHNTECLRLDRATMAYSLEARVPFLDPALVEYVTNLPMASLLGTSAGQVVEKMILRQSCEDLLPGEIVWRSKMGFYHASGILPVIQAVEDEISDQDFEACRQAYPAARLRDKFSMFLFMHWQALFGAFAGEHAFEKFGAYPVLQEVFDNREAMFSGTGETEPALA